MVTSIGKGDQFNTKKLKSKMMIEVDFLHIILKLLTSGLVCHQTQIRKMYHKFLAMQYMMVLMKSSMKQSLEFTNINDRKL